MLLARCTNNNINCFILVTTHQTVVSVLTTPSIVFKHSYIIRLWHAPVVTMVT